MNPCQESNFPRPESGRPRGQEMPTAQRKPHPWACVTGPGKKERGPGCELISGPWTCSALGLRTWGSGEAHLGNCGPMMPQRKPPCPTNIFPRLPPPFFLNSKPRLLNRIKQALFTGMIEGWGEGRGGWHQGTRLGKREERRKCHRVGTQNPQAWSQGPKNLVRARACEECPRNVF